MASKLITEDKSDAWTQFVAKLNEKGISVEHLRDFTPPLLDDLAKDLGFSVLNRASILAQHKLNNQSKVKVIWEKEYSDPQKAQTGLAELNEQLKSGGNAGMQELKKNLEKSQDEVLLYKKKLEDMMNAQDEEKKQINAREQKLIEEAKQMKSEFELLNFKIKSNLNKIKEMTSILKTMEEKIISTTSEKEKLQQECEQLRLESQKLVQQLNETKQQFDRLRVEMEDDKKQSTEKAEEIRSKLFAHMQFLNSKLMATEELLQRKQDEWQERVQSLQRSKEYLEQQTLLLQQNMRTMLGELERLETKCTQLTEALAEKTTTTKEKVDPAYDIVHLHSENDKLAEQLSNGLRLWGEEKQEYIRQIQRIEQFNIELRDRSSRLEQEIERLRRELTVKDNDKGVTIAKLDQVITLLNRQMEVMKSDLEEKSKHLYLARSELASLRVERANEVEQRDFTIKTLTEQIASMKGTLEARKKLQAEAVARLAESKQIIGCEFVNRKQHDGVQIKSITQGMPAAEAGLLVDDIIEEANGTELKNAPTAFRDILSKSSPGDKMRVIVRRKGDIHNLYIEVGAQKLKKEQLHFLLRISKGIINDEDFVSGQQILQDIQRSLSSPSTSLSSTQNSLPPNSPAQSFSSLSASPRSISYTLN